jgi:hypothetical protein
MKLGRIVRAATAAVLGVVTVVVLPFGAAQAAPAGDVYRQGHNLMLDGSLYRFVGFNAYGMQGCETGTSWTNAQLDAYFSQLPPHSMTRTWALQPWGTSALDRIVASADAHQQKLILSLADGPSNCETDGAALDGTGQPVHGHGKQNSWYASGYQTTYLPWVSTVAARYTGSTAIGMWEIMNEPGSQTTVDTTTMKAFLDSAAAAIKTADPNHLVETGTLAEYTPGTTDYQLIHSGADIDVGSLHEYDYDYNQSNTILSPHLAPTLHGLYTNGKPLIVGETGILSGGTGCRTSQAGRATADRQKFDAYLLSGAAGVLVWNYSPNSPTGCAYTVGPGDPLIGVVTGYTMPTPVPAPAGGHTLIARNSAKCLDVTGSSTANGVQIQQSTCLGSANQSFSFTPTDAGFYEIRSTNSGKCLDVAGQSLSNNALIDQWDCWGGDNQQFRLVPTTGGYFQLVVRGSERCLNVVGSSGADGALLQQYACNSGTNEQFTAGS